MSDVILNAIGTAMTGVLVVYTGHLWRDRRYLSRRLAEQISVTANLHRACGAVGFIAVEHPGGAITMRQVGAPSAVTQIAVSGTGMGAVTQAEFEAMLGVLNAEPGTSYDVPEDLSDTERVEKWLSE